MDRPIPLTRFLAHRGKCAQLEALIERWTTRVALNEVTRRAFKRTLQVCSEASPER